MDDEVGELSEVLSQLRPLAREQGGSDLIARGGLSLTRLLQHFRALDDIAEDQINRNGS